jgi:hypothetical protein
MKFKDLKSNSSEEMSYFFVEKSVLDFEILYTKSLNCFVAEKKLHIHAYSPNFGSSGQGLPLVCECVWVCVSVCVCVFVKRDSVLLWMKKTIRSIHIQKKKRVDELLNWKGFEW